jgi:hypothetical protein
VADHVRVARRAAAARLANQWAFAACGRLPLGSDVKSLVTSARDAFRSLASREPARPNAEEVRERK